MACGGHVDLTTITADGASIRIYEELRDLGYSGGYDAVCGATPAAGPGRGGTTSAEAYVPLFFPPGDACRFDWSHETGLLLNGVTVTVAHVRLCHSRMMLVRAYPRETQEMVFFGKDRRQNRRFLQMCSHYLVQPVACTPASGWEKGQEPATLS